MKLIIFFSLVFTVLSSASKQLFDTLDKESQIQEDKAPQAEQPSLFESEASINSDTNEPNEISMIQKRVTQAPKVIVKETVTSDQAQIAEDSTNNTINSHETSTEPSNKTEEIITNQNENHISNQEADTEKEELQIKIEDLKKKNIELRKQLEEASKHILNESQIQQINSFYKSVDSRISDTEKEITGGQVTLKKLSEKTDNNLKMAHKDEEAWKDIFNNLNDFQIELTKYKNHIQHDSSNLQSKSWEVKQNLTVKSKANISNVTANEINVGSIKINQNKIHVEKDTLLKIDEHEFSFEELLRTMQGIKVLQERCKGDLKSCVFLKE